MNATVPAPADSPSASDRIRRRVIWLVIMLGWALLFRDTFDIRAANLDDVNFHRVALEGRRMEYIKMWGPVQGRHYGYFAFGPIWLLDAIGSPWLYQTLRLGLIALSLVLLAGLAAKVSGSQELAQWWLLLWIAVLQIPPTFYGLLSYCYIHLGLIFTLLALHRFWNGLGKPAGAGVSWGAGLLFFVGLQFNESFLAFAVAFGLLWSWKFPSVAPWRAWRPLLPVGIACFLYLGIYAAYRFQQVPYYEGTVLGRSPGKMALYVFRYSASSLPGFELVIDREAGHPAFVTMAEIGRRLATLESWRLFWVLVAGGAATWLLSWSRWPLSLRKSVLLAAGTLVTGLLFLAMPAVSAKYQVFAYRRLYPHTYNFTFVHFLWLAVAIVTLSLVARAAPGTGRRRVTAGAFGLIFTAICLVCQVTNPLALQQIRHLVSTAP